jgi:transglutaminase-like putative cysteine protease
LPLLTVQNVTTYRYKLPVAFGEHRMMFRPRDSQDQRLLSHRLVITPEPAFLEWRHDVFGNCITVARFVGRAAMLRFESTLQIAHDGAAAHPNSLEDHARHLPFSYDSDEMPDLLRSIERQMPDPGHIVDRWARAFLDEYGHTGTLGLLSAITKAIRHRFTYKSRHEPGIQDPRTTLRLETGTCRDFALLMMEAVRSLGLAARFISGYLHTPLHPNPGETQRVGGGHTHAWLQVYLPGPGWVEFDPTNGIVGNRGLIRVASVRDPAMAIPLAGSWVGSPNDCLGMDVSVHVEAAAPVHNPAALGDCPDAHSLRLPDRL